MHQCINECGNDKGFPFSVFPDQSILNVTTPEYFFGRTNDKQQTQYQQYFILSFFHRIDAVDLRPRKIKKHFRKEVAQIKHHPEYNGRQQTKTNHFPVKVELIQYRLALRQADCYQNSC